jgi:hypothetical protein
MIFVLHQLKFNIMATINHLFDSGQGKLGNLVLYKVGGQGRVRTRADHFHDRRSPAQLAQRQRMQVVNSFLKPFRDLIRITFAAEAVGRSAVHEARAYHMRNALTGEYPDITVEKSRALLSRGPLPVPVGAKVSVQEEGLLIEWENDPVAGRQHPHDTLVVMALWAEKGYADYSFTGVRRSEGRYVWETALTSGNGNLPDVWIAFRNRQETEMSDSLYTGS